MAPSSSLDLPPEGLHRRFAPAHSLVRILEQEGLTWGILLNAYELRLVRRSEGFVSSHLAFSLLDLAADVPGARDAWNLIWGLLRGEAWHPAPALLDEVVRLGREHQQEVGSVLGSQVPAAVERLLEGALSHPANQEALASFLDDSSRRRSLLEHLHAGALQYLYHILFVLYAEARVSYCAEQHTHCSDLEFSRRSGRRRHSVKCFRISVLVSLQPQRQPQGMRSPGSLPPRLRFDFTPFSLELAPAISTALALSSRQSAFFKSELALAHPRVHKTRATPRAPGSGLVLWRGGASTRRRGSRTRERLPPLRVHRSAEAKLAEGPRVHGA